MLDYIFWVGAWILNLNYFLGVQGPQISGGLLPNGLPSLGPDSWVSSVSSCIPPPVLSPESPPHHPPMNSPNSSNKSPQKL